MFSRPFSQRTKSSTNSLEGALKRLSVSTQQTDIEAPVDAVGSLGLTLLFQPSEPLVDFIFVHGLGGGSRKTWALSKEPSHYWPLEWLPRDPSFKNVRIHTFGYTSKWAEMKSSTLNVHDSAKSLVAAKKRSKSRHERGYRGRETDDSTRLHPGRLVKHQLGDYVSSTAELEFTFC